MGNRQVMLVECQDCQFSAVVDPSEDGSLPADVVREHGEETGHTLSVSSHGE